MLEQQLYLAIDQGGSRSRALVFTHSGVQVCAGLVEVSTMRSGDRVEQQALAVKQSIEQCITDCLAQLSAKQQSQIVSAGLVTQRSSFVAVNRNTGEPISPIFSWQDTRAAKQLSALKLDQSWLQKITGLPASAHFGASKMAWCLQHLVAVQQAQVEQQLLFLPLAAYLAYALTDATDYWVDPANASRTLLMDINQLTWHPQLLTRFGIEAQWLPKICATQADYGALELAPATSSLRIPLRYVNGDQSSALFAYGTPKPEQIAVNLGTGAFVSQIQHLSNTQQQPKHGLLMSVVYASHQRCLRVIEGTVNGAGAALSVMSRQLSVEMHELQQVHNDDYIPIFINTIGGLAAPFWRTDLASYFIDEQQASAPAKLLAVLESIVFLVANIISLLPDKRFSELSVSGGLANNAQLCQRLADVCQIAVRRVEQVEASALGAVWWLAGQPNHWLQTLTQQVYQPTYNPKLSQRYQRWQQEMQHLLE